MRPIYEDLMPHDHPNTTWITNIPITSINRCRTIRLQPHPHPHLLQSMRVLPKRYIFQKARTVPLLQPTIKCALPALSVSFSHPYDLCMMSVNMNINIITCVYAILLPFSGMCANTQASNFLVAFISSPEMIQKLQGVLCQSFVQYGQRRTPRYR